MSGYAVFFRKRIDHNELDQVHSQLTGQALHISPFLQTLNEFLNVLFVLLFLFSCLAVLFRLCRTLFLFSRVLFKHFGTQIFGQFTEHSFLIGLADDRVKICETALSLFQKSALVLCLLFTL